MNKGIIVGRLVRNPELVKTTNGKSIANITLATNNSKDDTTFLQITIFSKMAEVVNQYCKKGDTLGVEYIVKNHNWIDRENIKHYDYTFMANKVSFIAKANSNIQPKQSNKAPEDIFRDFGDEMRISDDDLPFD